MKDINLKDVVETKFGIGIVLGIDDKVNTCDVKIGENTITMDSKYISDVVENYSDCNYEIVSGKFGTIKCTEEVNHQQCNVYSFEDIRANSIARKNVI